MALVWGMCRPLRLLAFLLVLAGCARDEPPPPAPSRVSGATDSVPVDVHGTWGPEYAGRRVVLVDANRARHETETDEDGAFHVEGVVPPYDVAIFPVVYLGVARIDPVLGRLPTRARPSVLSAPLDGESTLTVVARGRDVPESWTWTTSALLELETGETIEVARADGPTLEARLPAIPGAVARARTRVRYLPLGERPELHGWAESTSPPLPIASSVVTLDVEPGPELLSPAIFAPTSRRDLVFAWTSGAEPRLAFLDVRSAAEGLRLRVVTGGAEVAMSRLLRLGFEGLRPGDHFVDLETEPETSLDAAVASGHRAGHPARRTHFTAPFRVTP